MDEPTDIRCPRCHKPCWIWKGLARCSSVSCMWMQETGESWRARVDQLREALPPSVKEPPRG